MSCGRRGCGSRPASAIRIDLKLEVGALAETVNVVSESTLLQTEKADLSSELSSKQIVNLPLNQFRNYQKLIDLVPGATPSQFQNAEIDTPGRSLRTWVNGVQPNSNATRIDGAVSVNIWLPHHVGYVTSAEAIDTVTVSSNNFDADQGMAGGAATTLVTKSGTNQIHGSAFWFGNTENLNANTLFNNAFNLPKPDLKKNIYGATLGGPIVKNKLFFFGSWERYSRDNKYNDTYGVPTAKMRAGDFSEVAAAYPRFQLYDPRTGAADGSGRSPFSNYTIPGSLISPNSQGVMQYYPAPNTSQDLNANGLLDDYVVTRNQYQHRDNYDVKLTYQRSPSHSIWGRFGMLDNEGTGNNFNLGWDKPSLGDTRIYVGTIGHTWTLSPTLVLDGNFGIEQQNQTVTGPDYGTNYGLDIGIPGVNGSTERYSGMPTFEMGTQPNGYTLGGTPSWMPLFRHERSYTFTTNLTKVMPKHELRFGFDFVRHELNHYQAEFGNYGLKGGFRFDGLLTGAPGYTQLLWNQFADFLIGMPNFYAKDFQELEMTGRENQFALFVRDRWSVTQKLTLSLGVRLEYYPLMTRKDSGIERLDYGTYTVLLGGRGDVPEDVGINLKKLYFAPRLGAMYRLSEKSVIRAGYGRTINPLPWSRPMRGSFPYDINLNAVSDPYRAVTTLSTGIPAFTMPDLSTGHVPLPQGVFFRSPNPNEVDRGSHPAVERRFRAAAAGRHLGPDRVRGHGDGRRLRRPQRQLRHTGRRQRQPAVLRAGRHDRDQRLGFAHQVPLQGPPARRQPPVQERPDVEGCLHPQPGEGHDDERRGRLGRPPVEQPDQVRRQLRHLVLRPHPRRPARRALRAAVPQGLEGRDARDPGRLAGERDRLLLLRHRVPDRRDQQRAQLPGVRLDLHQLRRRLGQVGRQRRSRRALLRHVALLAADGRRLRGLREHRALVLPPSERVERGHVAVQGFPGQPPLPRGAADRGRERVQPPQLGRSDHDFHREQLPAVHGCPGRQRNRLDARPRDQRARAAARADRPSAGVLIGSDPSGRPFA